jgi:hypothetical protein
MMRGLEDNHAHAQDRRWISLAMACLSLPAMAVQIRDDGDVDLDPWDMRPCTIARERLGEFKGTERKGEWWRRSMATIHGLR